MYVDDILITGSSPKFVLDVITYIKSKFIVNELGTLYYFLSIEAHWDSSRVLLTQAKYIEDILKTTNMSNSMPVSTPIDCTHSKPSKPNDNEPCDASLYRRVVGSLQYLCILYYTPRSCLRLQQGILAHASSNQCSLD